MAMPDRIGAPRRFERDLTVFGNHDEAALPELGRGCIAMQLTPYLAVAVVIGARVFRRVETHHAQALARRAFRGFHGVNAIPHRRVGLLKRLELHWNIFEREK